MGWKLKLQKVLGAGAEFHSLLLFNGFTKLLADLSYITFLTTSLRKRKGLVLELQNFELVFCRILILAVVGLTKLLADTISHF